MAQELMMGLALRELQTLAAALEAVTQKAAVQQVAPASLSSAI
jgi:hypothetical protein